MARRRSIPEYADNHERWMVSYADFITLLFAFFVVMYSTTRSDGTTVSGGGLPRLSASILDALNLPFAADEARRRGAEERRELLAAESQRYDYRVSVPLRPPAQSPVGTDAVMGALATALGQLALAPGVEIRSDGPWVEITIPSRMIFPSGSRVLLAGAQPLLRALAEGLRSLPNDVSIGAHTDSLFIDNGSFPSNWELTTARAALIARIFAEEGVDPRRLSATGFAGFRPVADNGTQAGRARNRRIVLRIAAAPRSTADASAAAPAIEEAGPVRG